VSLPKYFVAIVGGATAGAEMAAALASRGIECAVFEQNPRPYGKIEDGLPRWHAKLRLKEYEIINERLDRPNVHFVPLTRIGRDVEFVDLAKGWGFTSLILAHGAWRDRRLPLEGAERYVDRGLIYQNSLIYWFNHYCEREYRGPRYELPDGAIVVGGGLASIDVMKVLQLETVRSALAARGIDENVLRIEHAGVPAVLEKHGLSWESLGLKGATLYYRRRIEDMPLAEIPDDADAERAKKFEGVRRRILEKAMQKYCFHAVPLHLPVGLIVENDRLAGLRFQRTVVEDGKPVPVEGAFDDVRAPLVVSSIGSIPEPMKGIAQKNELYHYVDTELGRLEGYDTVFSAGNVVTGKGNIAASRKHSTQVAEHVVESFLGLGQQGHAGEERMLEGISERFTEVGARLAEAVQACVPLDREAAVALMQRVRERQRRVGHTGTYREWIAKVTPEDLA
jgi:NADPH-dependent glutamate synthase beta subunit-like oxidoreductase